MHSYRKREIFFNHWFPPQMATVAETGPNRAGPVQSQDPGVSGLCCRCKGPSSWPILHCLPRPFAGSWTGCKAAGTLEPVPIWAANTTGGSLTCHAMVSAPKFVFYCRNFFFFTLRYIYIYILMSQFQK